MFYEIIGIFFSFLTYICVLILGYYIGKSKTIYKQAEKDLKDIEEMKEFIDKTYYNFGNDTKKYGG